MTLGSLFSSNGSLLLVEAVVYTLVVMAAIALPRPRFEWLNRTRQLYMKLASRRKTSVLVVIALVLVARGALIPVLPTPVPGVHDEFSYILAGETFAAGRLTNPQHSLWKSFETFYIIQEPTYASMYPPGQGMALAMGDILGGHPWIGVYLSVALMCGAICWMLQAWMPPHWALTGGLIAALRWGIYSYWMESYWGGAVAALAGALVAGAVPRILRGRRAWPAAVLGVGLLLLANSRPFEGVLFGIPVMGVLLIGIFRKKELDYRLLVMRVAVPLLIVALLGVSAMAYYFWRVTGDPLLMPYRVHEARYQVTDPFLWKPLRPAPAYRYEVMEKYHVERETAAYRQAHSWRGWSAETWRKAESLMMFYFWPAVFPTAFAVPLLWRNRKAKFAVVAGVIMFVGLTLEIWPMTLHYHAPITALMVLLLIQVMRSWRLVEWRGRPVGAYVSWAIPLFCAGVLVVRLGAAVLHVPVPEHGLAPWFTVTHGNLDRAKVQRFLQDQPGTQLVFVRYSPDHHTDEEWVHNDADIDASKVVWARDAQPDDNAKVLRYFQERQVWILDADEKPPRLTSLSTTRSKLQTH